MESISSRLELIANFARHLSNLGYYVGQCGPEIIVKTTRHTGSGVILAFGMSGIYVMSFTRPIRKIVGSDNEILDFFAQSKSITSDIPGVDLDCSEYNLILEDIDKVRQHFEPEISMERVIQFATERGVPTKVSEHEIVVQHRLETAKNIAILLLKNNLWYFRRADDSTLYRVDDTLILDLINEIEVLLNLGEPAATDALENSYGARKSVML